MKAWPASPVLLAAVMLVGGVSGHLIRKGTTSLAENSLESDGADAVRPLQSPDADLGDLEAATEFQRQWLMEAMFYAAEPNIDLSLDAPHLLLTLAGMRAQDFPGFMAEARLLPPSPQRTRLEDWILQQWLQLTPGAATKWALQHRPDKYAGALRTLAKRDAAAAWQAVQENPVPSESAGDTQSDIFSHWAAQDRMAALGEILRMNPRDDLAFRAGLGFGESALPDPKKDPAQWDAALSAMSQLVLQETEPQKRMTGIQVLIHAMERQLDDWPARECREALSAWLRNLSLAENEFATHLTMVAQNSGSTAEEAPEAWPWLWREVPASQKEQALKNIVEFWASDKPWSARDPNACGEWLNAQMPLGPEHAEALKNFALHAAGSDPAAGLAWAEANPDPEIRETAIKEVRAVILKQWPHRAEESGGSSRNDQSTPTNSH